MRVPIRLLLAFLLVLPVGIRAAPVALITLLDGEASVLRDSARLAAAEGVAVQADDLIETGANAHLLRIEFADGACLDLGPGAKIQLLPRLSGDRAHARAYVLTGWAKATVPKGISMGLLSPLLDVSGQGFNAVLAVQGDASQLFVESGEAQLRRSGAAAQTLKNGELLKLSGGKGELAARPTPAFVQAMPRAFMDSLPTRAAQFRGKDVAPKRVGALGYADVQAWIDAPDVGLRRANMPHWRAFLHDGEFKRSLGDGLKGHPEWEPVLYPPPSAAVVPAPSH